MKICYIAEPIVVHTQRRVKYFADRGYEVHLISSTPLGEGNIGSAELHMLNRFSLQGRIISFPIDLLSRIIQFKQSMRRIKPNILHCDFITDCVFWGALSGFYPLALTAMGSDILVGPRKSRIYRSFVEFALKRAD